MRSAFGIAPLLDRGWGYDPYVVNLIGRIRVGRPARECLFDSNSLFLRSGQDTEMQRYAAKKRVISDEDMAAYRAEAEKRRLANEVVYAKERADRVAMAVERQRIAVEARDRQREFERVARAQYREREQEWASATPRPSPRPSVGQVRIPKAGWWRKQGDDVVVAVMLQAVHDTQVLVGPEGAGLWLAKSQIKEVKGYVLEGGLHELRLDGALAKRLGFCNEPPTPWIS